MKKLITGILCALLCYSYALAGTTVNPHTGELQMALDIQTLDGNTIVYAPETLLVTNGTLSGSGVNATLTISSGSQTPWTSDINGSTYNLTHTGTITTGGLTTTGNITMDSDTGVFSLGDDQNELVFSTDGTDGSIDTNAQLKITAGDDLELDGGDDIILEAADEINLQASGDSDDYITIVTTTNVSYIGRDDDTDLMKLEADKVTIAGTMEATTITEGGKAVHNNDEMDASSELAAIIDDETGTDNIVFNNTPTIVSPVIETSIDLPANAVNAGTEVSADVLTGTQINEHTLSIKNQTKGFALVMSNATNQGTIDLYNPEKAVTLTKVKVLLTGGTNMTFALQECVANGTACANMTAVYVVTADTTFSNTTFSDAVLAAGNWTRFLPVTYGGNVNATVQVTYNEN